MASASCRGSSPASGASQARISASWAAAAVVEGVRDQPGHHQAGDRGGGDEAVAAEEPARRRSCRSSRLVDEKDRLRGVQRPEPAVDDRDLLRAAHRLADLVVVDEQRRSPSMSLLARTPCVFGVVHDHEGRGRVGRDPPPHLGDPRVGMQRHEGALDAPLDGRGQSGRPRPWWRPWGLTIRPVPRPSRPRRRPPAAREDQRDADFDRPQLHVAPVPDDDEGLLGRDVVPLRDLPERADVHRAQPDVEPPRRPPFARCSARALRARTTCVREVSTPALQGGRWPAG